MTKTDDRENPPSTKRVENVSARARAAVPIAALLVTVSLPAFLLWSWSRPVPVPPRQMPSLALSPRPVRQVLAADERAAARVPRGEVVEERERLFREWNLAEARTDDRPGRAERRRRELAEATEAIASTYGDEAVVALRAADLERAEAALRGRSEGSAADVGGFAAALRRYGMIEQGRQRAPRFVVRTTFKARWNAMHGRSLTADLSDPELQAYWGWLGLHASSASFAQRMQGLQQYEAAGGERAAEARGVLAYEEGLMDAAREAFEQAYGERSTFRLRNHALAAAIGVD